MLARQGDSCEDSNRRNGRETKHVTWGWASWGDEQLKEEKDGSPSDWRLDREEFQRRGEKLEAETSRET